MYLDYQEYYAEKYNEVTKTSNTNCTRSNRKKTCAIGGLRYYVVTQLLPPERVRESADN